MPMLPHVRAHMQHARDTRRSGIEEGSMVFAVAAGSRVYACAYE